MIGGLEPAIGSVLRGGLVVEAAVGEGTAHALMKEEEQQSNLDAFCREAVGIARDPSRSRRPCPLSLRRS
jgi:hypothetical protein